VFLTPATFLKPANFTKCLQLPLHGTQAGRVWPVQELLHGGLFEVALLGDERIEFSYQGIYIAQRSRR